MAENTAHGVDATPPSVILHFYAGCLLPLGRTSSAFVTRRDPSTDHNGPILSLSLSFFPRPSSMLSDCSRFSLARIVTSRRFSRTLNRSDTNRREMKERERDRHNCMRLSFNNCAFPPPYPSPPLSPSLSIPRGAIMFVRLTGRGIAAIDSSPQEECPRTATYVVVATTEMAEEYGCIWSVKSPSFQNKRSSWGKASSREEDGGGGGGGGGRI